MCTLSVSLLFLYCRDMRWVGTLECCSRQYNLKYIQAGKEQKIGLR